MPRDPTGSVVRNLFFLRRTENALAFEVDKFILDLFDDIAAQIARINPTAVTKKTFRIRRLEQLMGDIEELAGDSFDALHGHVRKRLALIGKQQGEWAAEQLSLALGSVADVIDVRPASIGINQVKAIIDTDPIQGLKLSEWFDGQKKGTIQKVRRQIQLGMAQNETLDQIVRRVRGRSAGPRGVYTGGVMQTTTREAEAIVRTSVNHIANEAAFRTYSENSDITEVYEYVATLDSRTTMICMGLDSQRFRYDDPKAPRPPQHIRCRSIIVPVIKWEELGVEQPPESTRASAEGQVPSSTKYQDWLKSQPADVQNEILGKGRAQLFREGKITLRDLVNSDNQIIPLDELKQKYGEPALTGPGQLKKQLDRYEQRIIDLREETAFVFSEDGELLFEKKGEAHFVQLTDDKAGRIKKMDGIFTHNHPSGGSFSVQDIGFAVAQNVREMRAVGYCPIDDRIYRHRMLRPEGGWPHLSTTMSRVHRINNEVRFEFMEKIRTGKLDIPTAEVRHFHEVWTRFSRETGIEYIREIWDPSDIARIAEEIAGGR